jgi:hypothetical protein
MSMMRPARFRRVFVPPNAFVGYSTDHLVERFPSVMGDDLRHGLVLGEINAVPMSSSLE